MVLNLLFFNPRCTQGSCVAYILMSLRLLRRLSHPSAPSCHLVTLTHMCTQPPALEVTPMTLPAGSSWPGFAGPPALCNHVGLDPPTPCSPPLCTLPALCLCLELLPEPWESSLRVSWQEVFPCSQGRVSAPLWTPAALSLPHLPHPHCRCLFSDPSVPIPSAGRELLRGRCPSLLALCDPGLHFRGWWLEPRPRSSLQAKVPKRTVSPEQTGSFQTPTSGYPGALEGAQYLPPLLLLGAGHRHQGGPGTHSLARS